MKLYIMRHGSTVWNEKDICQGRRQNRLSETGKEQVEQTANQLKDEKIDIIFSSPLFRTVQTANIMNKYHHTKVQKSELLTEIDQGIFEGQDLNALTEEQSILKQSFSTQMGMESCESIYDRTKEFFEYLLKNYMEKCVLVVTHACNGTCLLNLAQGKDARMLRPFKLDNAELKCVIVEKK